MHTQKLGVIGVGHVGSHVFTQAMNSGLYGEIVAIDSRSDRLKGESLDQSHATGLSSRHNVKVHIGDYADLQDADVIIISATHVYPPGELPADRQALLENNVPIFKEIVENIKKYTTDAILIWISNPVDTAVYMTSEVFGYPREKVLGTGTLLDSARLRYTLGKHYDVAPQAVQAYMLGEHGFSAFAALSRATIAGIPYDDLESYFPEAETLSAADLTEKVVQSAYDVANNKLGVTDVAVAQSAVQLAHSILLDEKMIYPVSSVLAKGTYGLENDLAISVPTVVGRQGVVRVIDISLSEEEQKRMDNTIDKIQESVDLGKERAQALA